MAEDLAAAAAAAEGGGSLRLVVVRCGGAKGEKGRRERTPEVREWMG